MQAKARDAKGFTPRMGMAPNVIAFRNELPAVGCRAWGNCTQSIRRKKSCALMRKAAASFGGWGSMVGWGPSYAKGFTPRMDMTPLRGWEKGPVVVANRRVKV